MSARVVLVHGSRLSAAEWAPVLPHLASYVETVAVDLPGHGRRAGERFTLASSAEVVQAEVAAAAPGAPVVVVGHSLGGYVALVHAARHSRDLAGVVLAGCSADPVGPGAAVYRGVASLTERLGPQRMERLTVRFLRRHYPPEVSAPIIAGGYYPGPTASAWREVMAQCRAEMLAEVRCPVLLLNGRYDHFRLGERRFRRVCSAAEVEHLSGAGHLANLSRPEEFADAVLRFVNRVA